METDEYGNLVALANSLEAENKRMRLALSQIARIAGNLPDSELTDATGPNDARHRGQLLVAARELAVMALQDAPA